MKRLQAYKYELNPNGENQRLMHRFAGSCRFVFNWALAHQKALYEASSTARFSYTALANQLPALKKELPWLVECPSQALQQALKDLERAYTNFFARRADFPRFKKKGRRDSFRYPQGVKLDQANSRIFLPKLGWIRYRNSRAALGTVKNVTVSHACGKWFVSIQTEREVAQPVPHARRAVGIDMGVTRFATLSDGAYLAPLNSFKRHELALRKAQQAMSRKVQFSSNWKSAKTRVQRIHARIGNARRDFLHKSSTTISQNHAMVCIEDLQVRNMSRSAAGSLTAPGKNVRAKSGLNKAILDQGWFEFRRQLDYKLAWNGGWLVAVPAHNTSCTCPDCGHVHADNRKTQARFECVACGFVENADVVGAMNVLRRAEAILSNKGQDNARFACEVNAEVVASAAGTRRSDLEAAHCRL
ncbi:MAG: cytosine methyltransferase [Pusillimonas sp.]|nr:cytosine methyltransferase [Pusillimonas sp.]|tara:strand:+ start:59476 stop:60720 length:1245 start_codon:yes stop_codon:yes gene_type:complete